MSRPDAERPMPLAELDACCGSFRVASGEQVAELFCENCPLIVERLRTRDEQARLREARAH